jgi:DNA-binding transcriptional LysR family regulator
LRAEQIEKAVEDFNRHVHLHDGRLAGAIRVTCAEPLAPVVVTPIINTFQARHPAVHVELLITERLLDLTAGKADIAVRGYDDRPRGERESALIQRKLADVAWAVYATRTYVDHYGKPSVPEEIGRHAIVAPDGAFSRGRAARWLQTIAPDATVSARSSTMLGLLAAVKSGSGLALLPKGIGEPEPNLVRVLEPQPPVVLSLYLLMHPDLRSTPRFRAFFDFFVSESRHYQPALRGDVAGRHSTD